MTVCKSDSKTLKRTDITSYWWILHAIITQIKLSTWTFSSHTRLQLEKTHANSCFSAHFLWWLSGENTRTKFIIIWAFYIAHWKQFQIKHQYCFNFALLHNSNTHLGHISGFGCKIWLQIYITVKKSWKTCEQLCLRSSGISVHAPDVLLELLNFSDNYFLFWMWDFQYTTEISGKCIRDINELLHTKKNLPHLQQ